MRKLRLLFLIPLLTLALAFECVDQKQETLGPSIQPFGSVVKVAQTFTVGISGHLTAISLDAYGSGCLSSGYIGVIKVSLTGTSGGAPSSTELATQEIVVRDNDVDPVLLTKYPFPTPVAVTQGDVLAIVLESQATTCNVHLGPLGDSYASGHRCTFNSTWDCPAVSPSVPNDWAFDTWIDAP